MMKSVGDNNNDEKHSLSFLIAVCSTAGEVRNEAWILPPVANESRNVFARPKTKSKDAKKPYCNTIISCFCFVYIDM